MKKEGFSVTPWDVKGNVDYGKLIKDFGVGELDENLLKNIKKHTEELHPMLKRNVFFAQRDLKWLLGEYERGNGFFLYTGCGPSGPIHLGHLMVWYFVKWLQDKFDVELWFQFTDDEKFLFKDKSWEEIQEFTKENIKDVAAIGFKPEKTHFLVDSKHAGLMYPEAVKIAKKITYSTVKASFGFRDDYNLGQIFYTSMQAVPAILPSVLAGKNIPCLIPLGFDQDPHFRVARDVYPKLGFYKPAIMHSKFLPALGGSEDGGKMSSTGGKAILSRDSPAEVKKKINKYAFSGGQKTVEEHRDKGGNPEVDVAFQYLKFFFEEDDSEIERIEKAYKKGEMLSGELKGIAIEKISKFLEGHQKRLAKVDDKLIQRYLFKH